MAKNVYKVVATMTYEVVVEAYDADDAYTIANQIKPSDWDETNWSIDDVQDLHMTATQYDAPDRNDYY